jgi:hypothetical protein
MRGAMFLPPAASAMLATKAAPGPSALYRASNGRGPYGYSDLVDWAVVHTTDPRCSKSEPEPEYPV